MKKVIVQQFETNDAFETEINNKLNGIALAPADQVGLETRGGQYVKTVAHYDLASFAVTSAGKIVGVFKFASLG